MHANGAIGCCMTKIILKISLVMSRYKTCTTLHKDLNTENLNALRYVYES